MIGVGKDDIFVKLCRDVLKRPELAEDERFNCIAARIQHQEEICEFLEAWSLQHTVEEVVNELLANSIPASSIMDISDLAVDPHFAVARNMFPTMQQPGIGDFRVTAMPIKFSDTETGVQRPCPTLGQHNEEVYGELLGLTPNELAAMKERGTI